MKITRHGGLVGSLLLLLLAVAAVPAGAAPVERGPSGPAFWAPPARLLAGTHGSVVWQRPAPKGVSLPGGRTRLIVYRSRTTAGRRIGVSGTLTVPPGRAPKGGWPLIAWAHGTLGIADQCAPTRDPSGKAFSHYDFSLMRRWLAEGYAIVRTDYEGLGTPGEHPYLIGDAAARSVLDSIRAARGADPAISDRVVVAGHSQGGQAALFSAADAKTWTPEIKLRGAIAFAPASHLAVQAPAILTLHEPGGLSTYVAMIMRSLGRADPALGIERSLQPAAAKAWPAVAKLCYGPLESARYFGSIAAGDILATDLPIARVQAGLRKYMDPEALPISLPLLVEQGEADTTVFRPLTDDLVAGYRKRGTNVTYATYPGIEHDGVLRAAAESSTAWIARHMKR